MRSESEPVFNVPPVVTAVLAVLAIMHALRVFVLAPQSDLELLIWLAFIPVRYDPTLLAQGVYPGGIAADLWTFVTYALLHGNLLHLVLNAVWLVAFGTPLARRFGAARFLAFFALTAAAGAAAHLATHLGDRAPMIGASAAVSGFMAAVIRFMFQPGGSLHWQSARDGAAHAVPAASLLVILRDPRIVGFLAIWFGINLVFGLVPLPILTEEQPVAWQAHAGGFLAGLLSFPALDPVGTAPAEASEVRTTSDQK